MRETQPKVHLIAMPIMLWEGVTDYLEEVGGLDWYHRVRQDVIRDPEALVEFAGRACYRSWAPELNANVKKVREDTSEYLRNILKSKHGSVLEHANFTFVFQDVSRVFTHELVRHRAGVAISQESLRYVRLTDLGFRIPDVLNREDLHVIERAPVAKAGWLSMPQAIIELVETLEHFQVQAAEAFKLDEDGVPFHYKKEVTSALRRLAPIGLSTTIVWTANVRTLRHVIDMRTAQGAEEEMRIVFDDVARIMRDACPNLFGDFVPVSVDEANLLTPHWQPKYEKV